MKTISIIIPVYNAASFIAQTINSVRLQTFPLDRMELIIINDGSTDQTAEVLKQYDSIATIINTPNRGVSAARETGRQLAKGEYIKYLDSDDLLTPDCIKEQIETAVQTRADVVYSNWQRFNEKEGKVILGAKVEREIDGDPEVSIFTDFWCPPAAILYSKRITDQIGFWHDNLPVIQDARYFWEAARHGATFIHLNKIHAGYRQPTGKSLSSSSEMQFYTDVLVNALEVYEYWKQKGLTDDQKEALTTCLRNCSNIFIRHKSSLLAECLGALFEIAPGYVPSKSRAMKWLSKGLGYKRALQIADFKRRLLS